MMKTFNSRLKRFGRIENVRALSSSTEYDLVIIGGGPGGYTGAIKAGQLGMKVACVESRGALGGTCLNVGCIPSKALLNSSHHYHDALHSFKRHGVDIDGVNLNLEQMMKNKSQTVTGLTSGIENFLFKNAGVDYVPGFGKIVSSGEVSVTKLDGGNEVLKTKNIMIATGSEVTPLQQAPVDNDKQLIVDSTGALELKKVPEQLVVIGGGVIGLELGSVWSRLGSQVTVVEYMDSLCPEMDKEITKMFQKVLKKQGLKFKMETGVTKTEIVGDKVKVTMEHKKKGKVDEVEADTVLVSTGRRPFTQGLGLENLGIETNERGFIKIDGHFKTNVDGIYAIGDCVPGPMLAHKAEEEAVACVENLNGSVGHVNYGAIPGVVYTYPEVAAVGQTEEEVKASGVKYNKGTFPFQANSRARANLDADGMVKVIADAETDQVLGVHILGPNAGELIAEATLALEYGASSEDIARTCHAHPTLSEAVKEAALATFSKPLNI
eukprot:maker-scaffold_6-snap-gene-19.40-mRNA-1 protein AED:0.01 eAED:0.01 QI:352/1/1/1/1/1/2/198/493